MDRKHVGRADGSPVSPPRPSGLAGGDAAWDKLLAFISAGGMGAEEAYRSMRERLLKFFAWRGSHNAEELADETLTRVALKLAQRDVQAERPGAFVLGVARMIDLEWARREQRQVAFDDATVGAAATEPDDDKERLLKALELCLQRFSEDDRHLMLRYHEPRGERRVAVRQAIAAELATALNALRVRMHRMRQQLESCVQQCLAGGAQP